jgi:hypothetical protein
MAEADTADDWRPPDTAEIANAAIALRTTLAKPLPAERVASALSDACRAIGWGGAGREARSAIAGHWGWFEPVLQFSLQALCRPFVVGEELRKFACGLQPRSEVIGFVMPGNIPGGGLHELIATLLAGRAAIVKTSSREPVFFRSFARVLAASNPDLAARLVVFTWGREAASLTTAMRGACDRLVVFGDDETIMQPLLKDAKPGRDPGTDAQFAGFGARVSGIVLTAGALKNRWREKILHTIALDIIAFEQRGCLSPHHIFIGGPEHIAEEFATALARYLEASTSELPPPPARLALEDAAAVRRVRERARWRAIGGRAVRLREGPLPGWCVIYDRDADFTASPGFRTVFVSPFASATNLERRLAPVAGGLEAMAFKPEPTIDANEYVAALRRVIEEAGATYICEPGQMQSPPLDWAHGGGIFLRSLIGTR